MKILLDLLPAVAFLGAYWLGDIYTATIALIVSLFAVVALYGLLERRLHRMHLATAVVAALLGGVTLYFHDPVFIKLKPTLVYGLFAAALLLSHLIGERVLLQRIPQQSFRFPDPVWRKLNLCWGLYFAFCAGLNLYVAQNFDESVWVQFKAYGFTAMTLVFVLAQAPFVYKYLPQETA